ncbi:MAG: tyrosine-type recombinase/integrase [Geminicoccaceae bacterium]
MADRPDDQIDQKILATLGEQAKVEPVAARDPAAAGRLTREDFHRLADIPPELEWFANIPNPNTRRAYKNDIRDFSNFIGIVSPEDMRLVTRAHVIAWRERLVQMDLADATIRRKLSAIAALFSYLADNNAIAANPVHGVKRPMAISREGASPALSPAQARALLDAPDPKSLKGKRDRAIIATLLFHGLRRAELCALKVGDRQQRQGTAFLRIQGKGSKIHYKPAHPEAIRRIEAYLTAAGHDADLKGALFRPINNRTSGDLEKPLNANAVYRLVRAHAETAGFAKDVVGFCTHSLRATAATVALENGADIARVQDWLGHASPATTRIYDHRQSRPEDSPTFWVRV